MIDLLVYALSHLRIVRSIVNETLLLQLISRETEMHFLTMTMIDQRPHVAHIIDELPPDGAERLIADILKYRSHNFCFSVVCLVRGGEIEAELSKLGIPVIILGRRNKYDLSLLWRLVAWLRSENVKIVHTHLFTADTYGRIAAKLAGIQGIFSTKHNTNLWPSRIHLIIDWLLSWITTRVIGCTKEVAETLHRAYFPANRILAISNGIDLGRFQNDGPSKTMVRAKWNIPSDTLLLALIGRLHPQKGHDDLIEVLARLRDEKIKFCCLFVGSGDLRQALKIKIKNHNLETSIILAGQRNDIPLILRALDIFVMPSRWEGLPIALLEAMACACPVVASAVGGIPSVIQDGINGLLVPPSDQDALYQALHRLLLDREIRLSLGRAGEETVRQHYNAATTAQAYETLYRRTLGFSD